MPSFSYADSTFEAGLAEVADAFARGPVKRADWSDYLQNAWQYAKDNPKLTGTLAGAGGGALLGGLSGLFSDHGSMLGSAMRGGLAGGAAGFGAGLAYPHLSAMWDNKSTPADRGIAPEVWDDAAEASRTGVLGGVGKGLGFAAANNPLRATTALAAGDLALHGPLTNALRYQKIRPGESRSVDLLRAGINSVSGAPGDIRSRLSPLGTQDLQAILDQVNPAPAARSWTQKLTDRWGRITGGTGQPGAPGVKGWLADWQQRLFGSPSRGLPSDAVLPGFEYQKEVPGYSKVPTIDSQEYQDWFATQKAIQDINKKNVSGLPGGVDRPQTKPPDLRDIEVPKVPEQAAVRAGDIRAMLEEAARRNAGAQLGGGAAPTVGQKTPGGLPGLDVTKVLRDRLSGAEHVVPPRSLWGSIKHPGWRGPAYLGAAGVDILSLLGRISASRAAGENAFNKLLEQAGGQGITP